MFNQEKQHLNPGLKLDPQGLFNTIDIKKITEDDFNYENYKYDPRFAPHYFKTIDEEKAEEAPFSFSFAKHFNPELRLDSLYFRKLNSFIDCVEKAKLSGQQSGPQTCEKEFIEARRSALKGDLLYNQVARKYYYQFNAQFQN